jgi:hypothetical protein
MLGLCACAEPSVPSGPPPPVFTLGSLTFQVSSAGARPSATGLSLYFSDQVDVCQAISFTPAGTWTKFTLAVAPQASGATSATVVGPKPSPAPGEAEGHLVRGTGGSTTATLDTASGAVTWTANADGSVSIASIDVGFAGISERIAGSTWFLRACP